MELSYIHFSIETIENNDTDLQKSIGFLETSIKIKTIAILVVLLIGFIGHFLTIFVFSQKRFRINSSNVYLLCLSINDGFYLVIHFFEDTIEALNNTILSDTLNKNPKLNYLFSLLHVIDENELACRLINYLRYVLRFISAYIIVAFTIQRLLIVYSPMRNRFKSNKTAWKTVLTITITAIVINSWVPFIFEINKQDNDSPYCDNKKNWSSQYFIVNCIYISSIMLIPIILIFSSNSMIILITIKDDLRRKNLQQVKKEFTRKLIIEATTKSTNYSKSLSIENITGQTVVKKIVFKANKSRKLTRMLVLISFSYALLNLPYLIFWSLYFSEQNSIRRNYFYSALQISEIFFMLNYGVHFYLYCVAGSFFRNQLKYSLLSLKTSSQ